MRKEMKEIIDNTTLELQEKYGNVPGDELLELVAKRVWKAAEKGSDIEISHEGLASLRAECSKQTKKNHSYIVIIGKYNRVLKKRRSQLGLFVRYKKEWEKESPELEKIIYERVREKK